MQAMQITQLLCFMTNLCRFQIYNNSRHTSFEVENSGILEWGQPFPIHPHTTRSPNNSIYHMKIHWLGSTYPGVSQACTSKLEDTRLNGKAVEKPTKFNEQKPMTHKAQFSKPSDNDLMTLLLVLQFSQIFFY